MYRDKFRGLLTLVLLLVAVVAQADSQERVFRIYNAANGLADNSAQTINCTKTGRIVISTIGHINFYDGSSFSHIDPERENVYPLSNYSGYHHLYFDRNHHLWLKDTHSVTCVDLLTERFVPNVAEVFASMEVGGQVSDIFVDGAGCLWLMVGDKIVCKQRGVELPVLPTSNLQDVEVYKDEQMLLFYANGEVVAYDLKGNAELLYRKPAYFGADVERYAKTSVIKPYGNGFVQIRNGQSDGLLMFFDVPTRHWSVLMRSDSHLNNFILHDDLIYIGSPVGYWIYNIKTGEQTHITNLTLTDGRVMQTDVNTIEFDRQGGMWIGTGKRGLLYSKPFVSPFRVYPLTQPQAQEWALMMERQTQETIFSGQFANCVFRDSRGWTWVGTYTGIQLYKNVDDRHQTFTRKDGLMNDIIHSIIEDDDHNLWVSTSYGISEVVIGNGKVQAIHSYTREDNVPNQSFVDGRAAKLSDGTILMQTLDNVVAFHPAEFHTAQVAKLPLYPKLIRLMVNGMNVEPGTEVNGHLIISRAITRTKEINVSYDQNTISLSFSGLNYFRPIQTFYRYRVLGLDDEWKVLSYFNSDGQVDSNGILHLPLVGLRPGQYVIQMQASMSPTLWDREPYEWVLTVNEPWWRTTGVYLSLATLLLALLLANFIWYNRNTRLKMLRTNAEADILRRIRNFIDRCNGYEAEVIRAPRQNDAEQTDNRDVSDEFVAAMLKIVPLVKADDQHKHLSMHQLANSAGTDMQQFYDIISANIHKSPRLLVQALRLQRAAEMLRDTDYTIEEVAEQCGFESPNYFIASFYHQYKQTPADYRNTTPR